MSTPARPPIGQVFDPTNIPDELKALNRWAVWRASWNERRGKWDKIPHHPLTGHGLSTKDPSAWCDFRTALDALLEHPDRYAGLGLVLTGATNLIGVDLDGCVEDGQTAPWAQQIIERLGSYTERSPSGIGLRILALGSSLPSDFVNHEVGVEVYNGHTPRFLTVTGDAVSSRGLMYLRAEDTAWLQDTYRRKPSVTQAPVISIEVPELIDEALLPAIEELPSTVQDFLKTGVAEDGDNSKALHVAGIQLLEHGLTPQEALSVLAAAPGSSITALAHRGQDWDRAVQYLWVEHVQKALPKARTHDKILDDFEDCSEPAAPLGKPVAPDPQAQAPEAARSSSKPPQPRFQLQDFEQFTTPRRVPWFIKKVLPHADLGVIYGASTAGKSFTALDIVAAVARGVPWRGYKTRQARVVYVTAEGQEDFRKRVRAYARQQEIEHLPNGGMELYYVDEAPNLLDIADARLLAKQIAACPGGKPEIIVVDTLAQVMPGGNENSGEDVGKLLGHCKVLAKACGGAMVLLVHHSGKDETRGARGWSGLKAASDFEMEITREGHERLITLTKLKGGEDGVQWPFRLKPVVLGQDEDGDDITSCVVEHTDEMPEVKVEAKGSAQQALLTVLHQWRDLNEDWPTADALRIAAMDHLPGPTEGTRDRRPDQLRKALENLVDRGQLVMDGRGLVSIPRVGEQP